MSSKNNENGKAHNVGMDVLVERAKELKCLYAVDEVLRDKRLTIPEAMKKLTVVIPAGFTIPEDCRIRIDLWSGTFESEAFAQTHILYRAPLIMSNEAVGLLAMAYTGKSHEEKRPLLDNEKELLDAIASRISLLALGSQKELFTLLETLQRVDPSILVRIGERLRVNVKNSRDNHASASFDALFAERKGWKQHLYGETNAPSSNLEALDATVFGAKTIFDAAAALPQNEVYDLINSWMQEQRILDFVKTVDSKDTTIADILSAVQKYTHIVKDPHTAPHTETWLLSELAQRFLTNDNDLINLILDNMRIADFEPVLRRIIGSHTSRGNIGGKGAGIFIAGQILQHASAHDPLLADIRFPKTWYLAADAMMDFLHLNGLEEMQFYKYNTLPHLRTTYDSVVAKIKNAELPPNIRQTLSAALDELGDVPIVVRSSSLLEDSHSGAFSGKYKSLFLANQGDKKARLDALEEAILEVYSSTYNPDSFQYRRERGLLNFNEQMGVLIQEVVGRKIGRYFFPAFAGVAFSHNLLRWSPRITRDGGLVRMVMGLGTRAVDRVNDDFCVLFSPGQPQLKINHTVDGMRRYSPRRIDAINLEAGRFETIDALEFIREFGAEMKDLHKYVSVINGDIAEDVGFYSLNPARDEVAITFSHVLSKTDIPAKLKSILDVLSTKISRPVDIEFAHDGEHLYLLQFRPQGSGLSSGPAPIPKNLKSRDIVFTANRFITDAQLQGITHVVYVDPDEYGALPTREALLAVGEAVGLLNDMLPRRRFIMIGPGRWGSRGDIKLGVRVTYSDISRTAALIEVARRKKSYIPELSFGTHFFQDLVEAGIVYVPLYPDEEGVIFREGFFRNDDNRLGEMLPRYAWLSDVVRVIDVRDRHEGKTLSLHMNSDLEQGVAFLSNEAGSAQEERDRGLLRERMGRSDVRDHWGWRHYLAERVAEEMDMERFGVKGVYLFGSVASGTAGMGSDIDLLLHMEDEEKDRGELKRWLEGWSRALARMNYLQTGYDAAELLDVHFVTDGDIRDGSSFGTRIVSANDPATPLRVRE